MHHRLKTPLIKKSPLWIKTLRPTHFLHAEVTWCSRLPPVMRWKRDLTNGIKLFRLRGPFPLSDNVYDSSSNNLSNKLQSESILGVNDLLKTSKDHVVAPSILKEASPQRPPSINIWRHDWYKFYSLSSSFFISVNTGGKWTLVEVQTTAKHSMFRW